MDFILEIVVRVNSESLLNKKRSRRGEICGSLMRYFRKILYSYTFPIIIGRHFVAQFFATSANLTHISSIGDGTERSIKQTCLPSVKYFPD